MGDFVALPNSTLTVDNLLRVLLEDTDNMDNVIVIYRTKDGHTFMGYSESDLDTRRSMVMSIFGEMIHG